MCVGAYSASRAPEHLQDRGLAVAPGGLTQQSQISLDQPRNGRATEGMAECRPLLENGA
jgi:hypothetical protein